MLLALIRSIGAQWTSLVVYLSAIWGRLLGFSSAGIVGIDAPRPDEAPTISAQDAGEMDLEATGPVATTFLLDHQGFPITTPEQDDEVINAFIESIDSEAVCALASRYNHGRPCRIINRSNGSFNVCFFIEFDNNGPTWIVRVPIIPSLYKPWQKLLSEVATIQFLERKTRIPVPHILAYGRDAKLTKSGSQAQMFLILESIPGEPLKKKDLLEAPEEHRRDFYSQLIDILADLRSLEFPLIGSLMPNPDGSPEPIIGPVLSMTANRFRQHLPKFSSVRDYLARQFLIIEEQFRSPVPDITVSDVQDEVFVLHHLEDILHQVIDPHSDQGPFILNHLDLRCPNILVDKNLHIQGIIDWEFSSTVPRQLFTPPSWITAHDSIKTKKDMHIEFRKVLDEKSNVDSRCDQLRREWYHYPQLDASGIGHPDLAFCIAHLVRRPEDTIYTFHDYFAPKLYDRPIQDITSEFFKENKACACEVQRREEQNRLYTQYLKDNNLYVQSWQAKWLAESSAFMAELEAKDLKKKMEREKAQQYQVITEAKPSSTT